MIDAAAVERFVERERRRFAQDNPRSAALASRARGHWFNGVPLHWMGDWGAANPVFVESASGSELLSVDGRRYADFCLGDTGAMFGHSPPAVTAAIAAQAVTGLTTMLPHARAAAVGEGLARLFGLPVWQMTHTASEANRAALRWARAVTGRRQVLVFHGCYHGIVDETMVRLREGRVVAREGAIGAPFDNAAATRVVQFNDVPALERALAGRDVAAVLYEPVMTNCGMVLPEPGFHAALRAVTRAVGTLLVVDETHTLSSGVGGYTRAHGLEPDLLVAGKAIAGGLPCAVLGVSAEVAERMARVWRERPPGHSGMGTTLAGNPLALAALEAALDSLHRDATYAPMLERASMLASGLETLFARRGLDWHVSRVGLRVEFGYGAPPRDGREAEQAENHALDAALRLRWMNEGVLVTPFHNMFLTAPSTSPAMVERLVAVLDAALGELMSPPAVTTRGAAT